MSWMRLQDQMDQPATSGFVTEAGPPTAEMNEPMSTASGPLSHTTTTQLPTNLGSAHLRPMAPPIGLLLVPIGMPPPRLRLPPPLLLGQLWRLICWASPFWLDSGQQPARPASSTCSTRPICTSRCNRTTTTQQTTWNWKKRMTTSIVTRNKWTDVAGTRRQRKDDQRRKG